jgi:pyruvate dehydrogenase E1 component alpha subunit
MPAIGKAFRLSADYLRSAATTVRFATAVHRLGKKHLEEIYRTMLTARFFDAQIVTRARNGKLPKWAASGIGQEAGPAVISSFLSSEDWVLPPYRGYAHVIGKGLPLSLLAAEALGDATGPVEGRGNPGNYISPDLGLYANSDILGNNFPTATGMAYAKKYLAQSGIVVSYFGDGTATRSILYGSLNLAALWQLPVLWVCENNQYSVSTHVNQMTVTSFSEKARGFGIRSWHVDGNDIAQLLPVVEQAISYMRRSRKPAFIELASYRVSPHDFFTAQSSWYQDPAEKSHWLGRDPLHIASQRLLRDRIYTAEELIGMQRDAERSVEEAFDAVDARSSL